uniref:Lon protease (S16) C-terminal proteolytic domain protein n=1 Tax=Megaviridae environmental sample TaxID=1737588 RepID=A0A5J6VIM2_9VIRU|nr:MAG: Lon protease (S16) C-terminal proteolytic domain protein [Megaviridae environmental sample]
MPKRPINQLYTSLSDAIMEKNIYMDLHKEIKYRVTTKSFSWDDYRDDLIDETCEEEQSFETNVRYLLVDEIDEKLEKNPKFNVLRYLTTKIKRTEKQIKELNKSINKATEDTKYVLPPPPGFPPKFEDIFTFPLIITNRTSLDTSRGAPHDPTDNDQSEYNTDPADRQTRFKRLRATPLKNREEVDFSNMSVDTQDNILDSLQKMRDMENSKSHFMRVMESNMDDHNKRIILSKLETLESSDRYGSDHSKLENWVNCAMQLPFGVYHEEKVTKDSAEEEIQGFLNEARINMEEGVYGHDNAKKTFLRMIAQRVSNPESIGNVLGIHGPWGNGKTTLIKSIAKTLGRPFSFIALGGATDASFLEGHGYTYTGSIYGKIASIIMQAKCMNPVIFFDELDKVSKTPKGDEIINILMHATDTTQNSHFQDKYFGDLNIDLSKVIFVFSYNDPSQISRILRDRITAVGTTGFCTNEKIKIAKNYLIPGIIDDIKSKSTLEFKDDILRFIADEYTCEGGVRKFKELLYEMYREVNLRTLNTGKSTKTIVTKDMIEKDFLKDKTRNSPTKPHDKPTIGTVNGLYATTGGYGGLTLVEASRIPSNKHMHLELTGMQGKVMQESMRVAKTVAWKVIKKNQQREIMHGDPFGIHLHCPEGGTSKDGPSAGAAITTCLISLLEGIPIDNKLAMTGEINLNGDIMKIGGLKEKLEGAKHVGITHALCPYDNKEDLDIIVEKNPDLVDDNFKVTLVKHISQVLKFALVGNSHRHL